MIGSLFSGIGGLELGLERATGMGVAWQVEIDPWCRKVLAKHWPATKRFEDVKEVGAHNLDPVELICGGFPCQDVSGAGRGAGLEGKRSGLWFEFLRIVGEVQPSCVVVENVASGAGRWVPTVREGLEDFGYRVRAFALSAFDVGAPHMRKRVFIVADCDRLHVRVIEQWRKAGGSKAVTCDTGAQGITPHADGVREQQPRGSLDPFWRWSRNADGWSPQSPVCGVDAGISGRMDKGKRLKALGNAVVPQCAEVIGRMLVES